MIRAKLKGEEYSKPFPPCVRYVVDHLRLEVHMSRNLQRDISQVVSLQVIAPYAPLDSRLRSGTKSAKKKKADLVPSLRLTFFFCLL